MKKAEIEKIAKYGTGIEKMVDEILKNQIDIAELKESEALRRVKPVLK